MDNNIKNYLDYDHYVENALRNVVKTSLDSVAKNGLKNEHHFFISFISKFPGVIVPTELNSNDDEIKIILQHQFWNLKTDQEKFSVTLSFNGKKKKIVVPYKSILSFSDPSVGFGLQFKQNNHHQDVKEISLEKKSITKKLKKDEIKDADIVFLDAFRPKKLD